MARKIASRVLVGTLFIALLLVLLRFQGVLGRPHHDLQDVPLPPLLAEGERTAEVRLETVAELQIHPGFVEAVDPSRIAARVMAEVREFRVREGDEVEQGQVLVVLDDRDAAARLSQATSALDAARAEVVAAEAAFDRAERLVSSGGVGAQEWETTRAVRDAARATESRLGEALEEARSAVDWHRITAPFAGRVLSRNADPGNLTVPGEPLLVIYRPARLRLSVAVPEQRAAAVRAGDELAVGLPGLAQQRIRVTRILSPADRRTGTLTLHLDLPRNEMLQPGMLGRLWLPNGERERLVIPLAAIERIGQIERVQLVRDGRAFPTTVRTGKVDGELVEILSGLEPGERVRLP